MKKIYLKLLIILSPFLFFTTSKALTEVNFLELDNGKINTTIHFEEGFVGGLDITYKLSKDITVQDFVFSTKIQDSNYQKTYTYDANNHTLNIKITTGGISLEHNLLNEKKELNLGNIIIDGLKTTNYTINVNSLTIINNDWSTSDILKDHLEVDKENTFTLMVVEEPTAPEENIPSIDNNEEITDAKDNNSRKTITDNDNQEEENKEIEQEKENEETNDLEEEKETETISKSDKFLIGIIGSIIVIIGIGAFILYKKSKNEEK